MPTQAVAEYLAEKVIPHLEGIIFPSTQVGGEAKNIVLFHLSSRVQRRNDIDDSKSEIDWGWWSEEDQDGDDSITIWEQSNSEIENVEDRSGSVCLNSLDGFYKWILALVILQPGLAAAH